MRSTRIPLIIGLAVGLATASTTVAHAGGPGASAGIVQCPEGTSATVTCRKNPARGYVMRGTRAAETFVGSRFPDKMVGLGGNDVLRGRGGADLLNGGAGRDRIFGHRGADTLLGRRGPDLLVGGVGRDWLVGNAGHDVFKAGPGPDRIDARGQRNEWVACGSGWDRVSGARGDRVRRNCERVRR